MKDEIKKLLKLFIPFSIILFVVQYYFQTEIFSKISFYNSAISIYVFHFIITFLLLLALIAIKNIFFDKIGFAFMAFGFLKMLASIVFLLPLIQAENVNYIPDVIAFFIPYFFFLIFEIIYSIKLLNLKHNE